MKSFLYFFVLFISWNTFSQRITQDNIKDLDLFLHTQVEKDKYFGFHVIIAQNDSILISKGYGKTNIEQNAKPTVNTLYRMASMSKPVTTIAILKVCEENNIALDTPVSTHLNIVPDKTVTIRQMLSQTSGWGDWWNANHFEESYRKVTTHDYKSMEEFVLDYLKIPQIVPPGTSWHYGYSMEILAIWLEKVTSQSFTSYVDSNIFQPLGMFNSSYSFPNNHKCAYYHEKNDTGQWERKEPSTINYFPGSGALVSTASDYFTFCQMLYNMGEINGVRIVSQEMINEMLTVVIGENGDIIPWQSGYGFALGVSVRINDKIAKMKGTLGDYGWLGYLGTSFWIDPEQKIIGIVLSQRPYDGYKLTQDVKNILYTQK